MICETHGSYFYGQQASQFAFYRIPKVFFSDERYSSLSPEAKVLYGILLDRMELSAKNHWLDDKGRVYIIFTIEEVMVHLGCANKKACALLAELEKKAGLIERKTTTCENLGVGLAKEGKKVLLVDVDPQASLTIALGNPQPDELAVTLSDMMVKVLQDREIPPGEWILHHAEGIDLMPSNISLAAMDVSLVNAMSRERVLKQYLDTVKPEYDYILLDCTPSLGMLTINALASADTALVPVQAQYLSAKGLEQLLHTVNQVKRQINPKLKVEGILLTMVDSRTNSAKEVATAIREAYGSRIPVFKTWIPRSVRAAETSSIGVSIFEHDPRGKVAEAYHQAQLQHPAHRSEKDEADARQPRQSAQARQTDRETADRPESGCQQSGGGFHRHQGL